MQCDKLRGGLPAGALHQPPHPVRSLSNALRVARDARNRWIVRNYDLEFLKKFSMVIGFLAVVTVGLMAVAYFVHVSLPQDVPAAGAKRTEARIAPVGAVYAGSTGAARQAAAVLPA